MGLGAPIIAVVTRETRLGELKARWATVAQAKFRLQQAMLHEVELRRKQSQATDEQRQVNAANHRYQVKATALADGNEYDSEDEAYQRSLKELLVNIEVGLPIKTFDRSLLPTFDFGRCLAVIVIGQDGLVANTAKYALDLPILGVNPDPHRFDGILLPFSVRDVGSVLSDVVKGRHKSKAVSLAEVNLNDGQRMLAFNDFFVGMKSHVSARYTLESQGKSESQSSSGILISTGAGSTGWLSSMFNMAAGINAHLGQSEVERVSMAWDERKLVWVVREPFRSRHSSASLVMGTIADREELVVGSQMPANGVIFSDGVESDYLEFSSGSIARFRVSQESAMLVVPS